MDLHELIKIEGEKKVAEALGVTVGSLRNKRSGQRPLTIDDLFSLVRSFGSTFDVDGTVRRIGERRHARRSDHVRDD